MRLYCIKIPQYHINGSLNRFSAFPNDDKIKNKRS